MKMSEFNYIESNLQLPSPITELHSPLWKDKGIRLYVKRDDMIHQSISGNKWRKLKHNILHCIENSIPQLATFGGAFSNHISATASACKLFNIESIGFIRGESVDLANHTLSHAYNSGMKVIPVSKTNYADWSKLENITKLQKEFPAAHFVPEGGNNDLGMQGMEDLAKEILCDFPEENVLLVVPIGTACTAKGLRKYVPPMIDILGINVLKYDLDLSGILVDSNYHFGGYAKSTAELISFINEFKLEHKLALDPIYTGKMFYAIIDKIGKRELDKYDNILLLHTGGLQGIIPYNERLKKKNKALIAI